MRGLSTFHFIKNMIHARLQKGGNLHKRQDCKGDFYIVLWPF